MKHVKTKNNSKLFRMRNIWFYRNTPPGTCHHCKQSVWQDRQIPLSIDHIDGNTENNSNSNLRILCANCHQQTTTHSRCGNAAVLQLHTGDYTKQNLMCTAMDLTKMRGHSPSFCKHCKATTGGLTRKPTSYQEQRVKDLLGGKMPEARGERVKETYIRYGLKEPKCEGCGLSSHAGIPIGPFLTIHHKDDNSKNHRINNVEILCANCHELKHTAVDPCYDPNYSPARAAAAMPAQDRVVGNSVFSRTLNRPLPAGDISIPIYHRLVHAQTGESMESISREFNMAFRRFKSKVLKHFPELWKPIGTNEKASHTNSQGKPNKNAPVPNIPLTKGQGKNEVKKGFGQEDRGNQAKLELKKKASQCTSHCLALASTETMEKIIQIHSFLTSPEPPEKMVNCARVLNISFRSFEHICKKYLPDLWRTEPERCRKLDLRYAPNKEQIHMVKAALELHGGVQYPAMRALVSEGKLTKRRFTTLYSHIKTSSL